MAQSVKYGWLSRLSIRLDLSSGHGLAVHEFKPHVGLCNDSVEPAWDSLSLPLSAPPLLVFFFIFFTFIFERERERESQRERGREGDTASEAGSRLRAVSTEPDAGLEPMNCEIMT